MRDRDLRERRAVVQPLLNRPDRSGQRAETVRQCHEVEPEIEEQRLKEHRHGPRPRRACLPRGRKRLGDEHGEGCAEPRQQRLLPGAVELAGRDERIELRLRGGDRRVDQAVRGLALRHRDLGERLSAPQILGQGLPVDLEVGKGGVEHGADGLGGCDARDPRRMRRGAGVTGGGGCRSRSAKGKYECRAGGNELHVHGSSLLGRVHLKG